MAKHDRTRLLIAAAIVAEMGGSGSIGFDIMRHTFCSRIRPVSDLKGDYVTNICWRSIMSSQSSWTQASGEHDQYDWSHDLQDALKLLTEAGVITAQAPERFQGLEDGYYDTTQDIELHADRLLELADQFMHGKAESATL